MPSKYCGKLPRCKNSWWCAIDYRPTDNVHCFEPLTNYDRIISKSPEELAKFIANIECEPTEACAGKSCDQCILEWLKKEAEDGIL